MKEFSALKTVSGVTLVIRWHGKRQVTWSNFIHPLKVSAHAHLLIKLRTLGQERVILKVADSKDVCTAFARCANDLWRVDFGKFAVVEVLTEEFDYGALKSEDGLIRGGLCVTVE